MVNGNGSLLVGAFIGFIAGFFVFTAFGREIIATGAERARYEAREAIIPRLKGR